MLYFVFHFSLEFQSALPVVRTILGFLFLKYPQIYLIFYRKRGNGK